MDEFTSRTSPQASEAGAAANVQQLQPGQHKATRSPTCRLIVSIHGVGGAFPHVAQVARGLRRRRVNIHLSIAIALAGSRAAFQACDMTIVDQPVALQHSLAEGIKSPQSCLHMQSLGHMQGWHAQNSQICSFKSQNSSPWHAC